MTISLMLPLVGKTQTDLKRVDKGTGPLTFTRATTATRINPDTNLIEAVASGDLREDGRGYYNRLLYSEDFSQAAWVKTNVAVSNDNVLGPNGKTGVAQTLTASAGNGTCLQALTDGSRARYGSLYLKRKTGTGTIQVTIDGGTTWTTVAVTAAWTRLGAGQTLANPSFGIRIITSGDAVYAFAAQVEDASAATRYRKSGANPAYAPLGILIEGQRTNVAVYSEQIDNAIWNKYQSTISANAVASPDGTVTADKIVEAAPAGEHYINVNYAFTDSLPYTWSVYAKQGERTWCHLTFVYNDGTVKRAWFNLSDGVVGTVQAGITASINPAPNGFFRCSITASNIGIGVFSNRGYFLGVCTMDNELGYVGDITKGIYVWGGQVEQASFPSSYIPTTSAAVTRNADVLTFPTAGNMSGPVGGFFSLFDFYIGVFTTDQRILYSGLSVFYKNPTGNISIWDGTGIVSQSGIVIKNILMKGAFRWANSEMALTRDGLPVASGIFDGDMNLAADAYIDSTHFGHIKFLMIFNRALTDAEMIALTS